MAKSSFKLPNHGAVLQVLIKNLLFENPPQLSPMAATWSHSGPEERLFLLPVVLQSNPVTREKQCAENKLIIFTFIRAADLVGQRIARILQKIQFSGLNILPSHPQLKHYSFDPSCFSILQSQSAFERNCSSCRKFCDKKCVCMTLCEASLFAN